MDGINACDKQYLRVNIFMSGIIKVEDSTNIVYDQSTAGVSRSGFVQECKIILENDIDVNAVKLGNCGKNLQS